MEVIISSSIESELLNAFQSAFTPNDTRPIYTWANEYVTLSSGYSITGKFDCGISPHFKKIFDAHQDPFIREVNILAPPRSGKTLLAEICLLHTLSANSGDVLWLQETDDKADKMSDLRMVPLLKSCQPVNNLIPSDRFSITDGRYKFLHSTVHITSPKPSTLNSVGYKFIFGDECWRYKGESIIKDIKRRSDDYKGVSKSLFFSQGGTKDSAWYEQYNNGECYEYGWTCPKCIKLQTFEWSKKRDDGTFAGMVWPRDSTTKDANNKWIIKECAKQAVLECYHCKFQVTDNPQNRKYLLDSGDYIKVKDGDSTVKSFRFTNICNVKISFAELVTRYLQAKQKQDFFGSTSDIEAFITKDLADWWDEFVKKTRIEIRLANYDASQPFGDFEKHRFLTIDVQKNEFYYVVRAWTGNGESRLIAYGKANTWLELDAIRTRHKVDYRFVFVDTGNKPNEEHIYAECLKYGRWAIIEDVDMWACYNSLKGSGQKFFKHSDNKTYRYNEPVEYTVGTGNEEDEGKSLLHVTFSSFRMSQILETLRDGKGKKWEATDVNEEYTKHLNSTILQRKIKGSTADFEYVSKPGEPEHYWDCEKMQIVAADLYGCLSAGESQEDKNNQIISNAE